MLNKNLTKITCFLLAVLISCLAGVYKNTNKRERLTFSFDLSSNTKESIYIFDIANQGFFKNFFQPNIISLYGNGKIASKNKNIYARFSESNAYLSQGSKKSTWKKVTPKDKLVRNKKDNIRLGIEYEIPKNKIHKYNVATENIVFSDDVGEIGTIKFKIINSKYPQT